MSDIPTKLNIQELSVSADAQSTLVASVTTTSLPVSIKETHTKSGRVCLDRQRAVTESA